jgi:glycosyltransferase involved in cell wall biosynthesis
VFEENSCSDAQLSTWLRHARALLFPSFVEGYGMPLVEALSIGLPVIASDLPVFREIAGDIPDYADPLDGPRWTQLILDHARADSPRRVAQFEKLPRFRQPTWSGHMHVVDEFLERLERLGDGIRG